MSQQQTDTLSQTAVHFPQEGIAENALMPLSAQDSSVLQPVRPECVEDGRDEELRRQADALVAAILANPMDVSITSQLYALGGDAMSSNTQHVTLMDAKIGDVLKEVQIGSPVAVTITQIKTQLDLVNPAVVSNTEAPFQEKFLNFFKRTVTRLPKAQEVLLVINERRDTVATTVDALKRHLWEEKDKALSNAIELGQVADRLFETRTKLQEAIYQGQLVWAGLNKALSAETDPVRQQALRSLVSDLSLQVLDFQMVDTMNGQSRMGAESLINSARKAQQLVRRITDVLLPAVAINLVVKAAAAQQAALVGAARDISAAATQTLLDTARQTRQAVTETARMQTEMLVNMEGLEGACAEYVKLSEEMSKIMTEAEGKARTTSAQLSRLSEVMNRHADPLTRARQARQHTGV